jgi:coenzyme Q-binding protein COQ10
MAHLTESLFIDAPVDRVDDIVRDPGQWPKFWVGMEEPDRIDGDGGPGTKVQFNLYMMGVRMHETEETVDEKHNADGSTDWRWKFDGTTSGWLTCHHEPIGDGTTITTEFDYTLPGSVLGKVADRLVIEKMQSRDFRHSLENLKLLAEETKTAH